MDDIVKHEPAAEALEDLAVPDSDAEAVAGGKKNHAPDIQPANGGAMSSHLAT